MARALLKKSPGDAIELHVGKRHEALVIDRIRYE
jgi:transcription elongation GreA/GreB family factor